MLVLVLSWGTAPSPPRLRAACRRQLGKVEGVRCAEVLGEGSHCCYVALGKWLSLSEPLCFLLQNGPPPHYLVEMSKQAHAATHGLLRHTESVTPLLWPWPVWP